MKQPFQIEPMLVPERDPGKFAVDPKFCHFLGADLQQRIFCTCLFFTAFHLSGVGLFDLNAIRLFQRELRQRKEQRFRLHRQDGEVCIFTGEQQQTAAAGQIQNKIL